MDTLSNYNIRGYRFIVWFFRLLLLFAATVIVLLFVLRINDTVAVKDGQVIAATPQADFISPADGEIARISVQEGQSVKKGDTLMILRSLDLLQLRDKTLTEIGYLQEKVASGKKDVSAYHTDYNMQLMLDQETMKKIESELAKLMITTTVAGSVNYVFNTKQASNLIGKGEILVSIVPQADRYYAKVPLPEKDVPVVKVGMPVRLKMDAYQSMEYGLIRGKVTYISERKQDSQFFALVDLTNNNKFPLRSGYSLYGEIVLQQLPLYKYLVKKLFRNE